MTKKSPRRHSDEFKQETVDLVLKQGYSVADAAQAVGITPALLYKWKAKLTEEPILNHDEKAELLRLRKEIKQLRMEQEILKKASVESTDQCNTCVKTSYFDHFLVGNYGTHETVVYQAR